MNRVYGRLWTVPYRSFQELRKRLKEIEAAVERSEPEARRVRREAIKGTAEEAASKQGRGSAGGNAIRSLPMRPTPAGAIGPLVGAIFCYGRRVGGQGPARWLILSRGEWRGIGLDVLANRHVGRTGDNLAGVDATGATRTGARLVDANAR